MSPSLPGMVHSHVFSLFIWTLLETTDTHISHMAQNAHTDLSISLLHTSTSPLPNSVISVHEAENVVIYTFHKALLGTRMG